MIVVIIIMISVVIWITNLQTLKEMYPQNIQRRILRSLLNFYDGAFLRKELMDFSC